MMTLPAPDGTVSAIQPDGRFVFAYADEQPDPVNGTVPVQDLGRLNLDGSADTSFGSAGVITSHPIFFEGITSMAVTPSGNIAIAGSGTYYGTLHQGFADVFDPAGKPVASRSASAATAVAAKAAQPSPIWPLTLMAALSSPAQSPAIPRFLVCLMHRRAPRFVRPLSTDMRLENN